MPLDLDKYRPYLDGFDLTDDQKTAMIEALWSIAEEVTDLAYGVHSTQLIQVANDNDSCSKNNVINFFRISGDDVGRNDLDPARPGQVPDNDNIPQGDPEEKETGT